MKRLLNTLYVTSPNRYISLDGENVVVSEKEKEVGRIPLHNLEMIVTFGYTGASPALMGACASRHIGLVFLSGNGRFLARIVGESYGNVNLRKEQYRRSDDVQASLEIAKSCISGKIYNSRWILERAIRDYPLRLDTEKIRNKSRYLAEALSKIQDCDSPAALLGLEGEAATVYFSVLDDLILQQKDVFHFTGRSRRPPLDEVNAMLSFAYTLLTSMCANALETVGLDPYVGFFHTDRPGRKSLALDMVEELRGIMADRFVLTLINKKMIGKDAFDRKENGAVFLNETGRREFLSAWQKKKQESITHPFLGEKLEWGMVPFAQAMLLSRYLRGDLDGYPPFFWK